jgi:hypothetical protein
MQYRRFITFQSTFRGTKALKDAHFDNSKYEKKEKVDAPHDVSMQKKSSPFKPYRRREFVGNIQSRDLVDDDPLDADNQSHDSDAAPSLSNPYEENEEDEEYELVDDDDEYDRTVQQHQLSALEAPLKKYDRDKPASKSRPEPKAPYRSNKSENKNTDAARNGCWNMLKTGKCELGEKCRFSHDAEDLRRTHAQLTDLLKQNERKYGTHSGRKPGGEHASSSD